MSKTPHLRPLGDRVIVRRDESEGKTPGGLVVPQSAQKESCFGVVVAAGPGSTTDEGIRLAMSVKPGDRVAFSKYGPTEINYDGEVLLVLREGELLAVVEEAPGIAPGEPDPTQGTIAPGEPNPTQNTQAS